MNKKTVPTLLFRWKCVPVRRRAFAVVALFLMAIFLLKGPAESALMTPPPTDREASERAFLRAYDHFLENNLWSCMDDLQEALRHNTYFVDTYYLRSLALRRIGRYPDAMRAMSAYLEVRRDDHRGRLVLDVMKDEWRIIKKSLYPTKIMNELFFNTHTINMLFGIPMYTPISLVGMDGIGKLSSSGRHVFVCDTLGDAMWFFRRDEKPSVVRLEVANPVVVLPLVPSESLLLQKNGEVRSIKFDFTSNKITSREEARLQVNVSDAALIDSTLMVVADRTGQSIRFYGLPSMGETAEWRPTDSDTTEKLFEPVAIATYGPFIAVADRGNNRVFVLDSYTLSTRDVFDVELPRDVEWGNQGELYVLSETGRLYARYPIASKKEALHLVAEGMKNAWSLAWTNTGPIISDVSGRLWWTSGVNPGHDDAFGALTLHDPWMEVRREEKKLFLRGTVSSVFHDFIQRDIPGVQAIWRNEVRPARITEVSSSNEGSTLYYSPSPSIDREGEIRYAVNLDDVMEDIAKMSRAGRKMPRVIVLDTRILHTEGQLTLLFSFLMAQGIRLDLWAIGRPASVLQTHISRITLGNTYYSRILETVPFNDSTEWILSVPLPPEISTFGYPSDATLSIFATIDMVRFMDWVPIWPSLIKKK